VSPWTGPGIATSKSLAGARPASPWKGNRAMTLDPPRQRKPPCTARAGPWPTGRVIPTDVTSGATPQTASLKGEPAPVFVPGAMSGRRPERSLRSKGACIQEIRCYPPPAPVRRPRFVCHGLPPSASFLFWWRKEPLQSSLCN
jgi:hypothetical protein